MKAIFKIIAVFVLSAVSVSAQTFARIDSTIIVEINGKEADSSDVISGVAMLRVQFLGTGKVGQVSVLSAEPKEVGDRAIADIKRRPFQPEERNGTRIDVVKTILYVFSITYDEDSPALKQKALIASRQPPNFSTVSIEGFIGEKVTVSATLAPTGKVVLQEGTQSDLPPAIIKAVRDAVRQIQFKPALHKSGKKVAQAIQVTYEIR